MRVAEAVAEDHPALSLPRLADPELRSRVTGYLATAPVASAGWHTDGVWVWPHSLAETVRARGVGPGTQLLDHMLGQGVLLPDEVAPAVRVQAAQAVRDSPIAAPRRTTESYFAGFPDQTRGPSEVIRLVSADQASWWESLGSYGWQRSELVGDSPQAGLRLVRLCERAAAELIDQLCACWYDSRRRDALESVFDGEARPRLARVFDGESPQGRPWFSPGRSRVIERARRERTAAYLSRGQLVIRASGRVGDPLDPGGAAVLPLSWRTDGVWVWQEALAHYVRLRGIAPELALLCHIEEQGYLLPPRVEPELVEGARAAVRGARPPRLARGPVTYFLSPSAFLSRSARWVPAGGPTLLRRRSGQAAQVLGDDLRWQRFDGAWPDQTGGAFRELSEHEAIEFLDSHWRQSAER